MSINEQLKQSERQDQRLTKLEVTRRNFKRTASEPLRTAILESRYFDVLAELLIMEPTSWITGTGLDNRPPYFGWPINQDDFHCLTINTKADSLEIQATYNYYLHIAKTRHTSEWSKEVIPFLELPDVDKLEKAIIGALRAARFQVTDQKKQLDFKGYDPQGYFEALRLHPFAFRGLSKEEGDELLKSVFRFAANRSHPDRGGSEEIMKQINNARDFFDNPDNRVI